MNAEVLCACSVVLGTSLPYIDTFLCDASIQYEQVSKIRICDVFCLIRLVSASWSDFGTALQVSHNIREALRIEPMQSTDGEQQLLSDVTLEMVIMVLVDCRKHNLASEVQEYLEKPEVYDKCISKSEVNLDLFRFECLILIFHFMINKYLL